MSISAPKDSAYLSGKVIPAHFVRMVDAHPKSPLPGTIACHAASGSTGATKEPKITLIKDGDSVKAIEVQCTCGAVIRLDCEY